MGFNMSGSEVGRGECLQPRGGGGGGGPARGMLRREKFSFLQLEEAISRSLTQVFLTN